MSQTVTGGGIRQSVALSAEGDAVAIALSEYSRGHSWLVELFVMTHEGQFPCGQFRTVPAGPNVRGPRIIATCTIPGAKGWMADFSSTPGAARAEVTMSLSKCCPGVTGLTVMGTDGKPLPTAAARPDVAIGASRVVTDYTSRLWEVRGENTSASDAWIMLFDATAVPANGTTPVESAKVLAGLNFFITPSGGPATYQNGIVWAISSTAGTFTAVAHDFFVHTDVDG